jgi:ribosomal protein S18 acetylase RimI-like enzyme
MQPDGPFCGSAIAEGGILMHIVPLTDAQVGAASAFFNVIIQADGLVYAPLSPQGFEADFYTDTPRVKHRCGLLTREDGAILGLAGGTAIADAGKAYVTFVAVDPALRRQGWGSRLLAWLEKELLAVPGEKTEKLEIVFFNPAALTWIVPGTPGHDHPNSPGIDVSTPAYLFFKNSGYRDFATQNSYYLPLSQYEYPPQLAKKLEELAAKGVEITRYDPQKHEGLAELMDALGNEDWRQRVLENARRPDGGDPLLIVAYQGRAMGFTGPMAVQASGRGYFAGIGLHPDLRGMGAGKTLFAALCRGLKELGAGYMTLFTGENNPARNIYEAAGFKIVKTWADMRKEV